MAHVQDRKLIPGSQKGFGYASLTAKTPVTPETLFFTASTTKSFTAAGLSLLIDNSSSLDWTTPISTLLRDDFVLSDDWATAHITIEDALCHRTGYPRHDLSVGNDTRELVRSLRHLPMSAEPRARFQYNNMMFATAGYLVSTLTGGLGLGAFFHRYLWAPMGMNGTFFNDDDPEFLRARAEGRVELATPYWWVPDQPPSTTTTTTTTPGGRYVQALNVGQSVAADGGAGAVISNVRDYAQYLRVMMAEAGPVSKAGHAALKRARTIHHLNEDMFTGPVMYGLGWMTGVFENHQVFWHTGTVPAFVTFMVMIPSKNWGVVVMSNSNSYVRELVTYRAMYDFFGVEEARRRDWEAQYVHFLFSFHPLLCILYRTWANERFFPVFFSPLDRFAEADRTAQQEIETCAETFYPSTPNPPLPPSLPLAKHTGQYRHVAYGDIFVRLACSSRDDAQGATSPGVADDPGATPGRDEHCRLVATREPKREAQLVTTLKHATGDFWLGYAALPETPDKVEMCLRAQFEVDVSGVVAQIGLDMRQEGKDVPLVWFERVSQ